MSDDARTIAERCAEIVCAKDKAIRMLGMTLEAAGPGSARLAMTVTEDMTNGHGMCHGGFVFTLADCAFAVACNTHDEATVAQHCAVTFLRATHPGDRLVAEAVERSRTGRSGIYDISVKLAGGEAVAEFRGHSRTIGGKIIR